MRSIILALISLLSVNSQQNFSDKQDQRYFAGSFSSVRITKLEVFDNGESLDSAGGAQVDTSRGICSEEDTDSNGTISETERVYEPFADTIVGIEVTNGSNTDITFSRVYFEIKRPNSSRSSAKGKKFALITGGEVPAGETKKLYGYLLKTNEDSKVLNIRSADITIENGFKTVRAHLIGRNSIGKKYQIKAQSTFSFTNLNNC